MEIEKYWQNKFDELAVICADDFAAAAWTKYARAKRMLFGLKFLKNNLHLGDKVLDAGCGPGNYIVEIKKMGFDAYGFDYSQKMVERAHHTSGCHNIWLAGADNIGAADNIFDVIIAIGLLQHISDPTPTIRELYRCLKPGGQLILNTLNSRIITRRLLKKKYAAQTMLIYSDPTELKVLFERIGFKNVKVEPFFLYPKPIRFLTVFDTLFSKCQSAFNLVHDFFLIASK